MAKFDTIKFFDGLKSELGCLDPVLFAEQKLTIRGGPFHLMNCGRDYLHEIYRYVCLEATGAEGIPVVVLKGRQVELTTTASVLCAYFMCSGVYGHIHALHAFPAVETSRRHSNGPYDSMITNSVDAGLIRLKVEPYSVTEKHYQSDNVLYIDSTSKDGDRLRGLPLDIGLFDEIQDMTTAARENTQQALSHSIFGRSGEGLEIYFGTPKSAGSDFERLWESSDQRYYHLRCPHCKQYMPITLKNFKTGFLVECDYCHKMYEKTLGVKHGKWVPTRVSGCYRKGYHISQLLVPHITREAIDRKREELSPRAFKNEVLGEFYTGMSEAPTLPEIIAWMTKEPDSKNLTMSKGVSGRQTYMGIDWGARVAGEDDQGTGGYTIVTIISVDELSKKMFIEFAHRMTTDNVDKQIEQICKWIQDFNCAEVVADIGYGHAQCQRLQEKWGQRFHPCYSSGNAKKTYGYQKETNMITVHKDRAVEEVYDDIMQSKYVAPYAEPERIEWLFEQLANVEITSATVHGLVRKKYQKQGPTRAIDALMSLMYSRIGWKFRTTQAFRQRVPGGYADGRSLPLTTVVNSRFKMTKMSSARKWANVQVGPGKGPVGPKMRGMGSRRFPLQPPPAGFTGG